MAKLTVKNLNVQGKRVFMRVDYNVPLEEKDGQMVITDPTRIVETLPTLRLLIERGAKLILAAHLGRPKGKREASMSLRPASMIAAGSTPGTLNCSTSFVRSANGLDCSAMRVLLSCECNDYDNETPSTRPIP